VVAAAALRTEETDTLIVGAGPAGLATAACLRRAGVPFLIVEAGATPGARWRERYDRLHLHTIKRFSALPYLALPRAWPRYVSRDQFVRYLEVYARRMGLLERLRPGERVVRAAHDGGRWEARTAAAIYRARCLVVATGYSGEPHVPSFPGADEFRGEVLHSAAYRNPAPFRDKRVVIVGIGNSGAEIAVDLCRGGAAEVVIAVRGGVHIMPRDSFGIIPAQLVGLVLSFLPADLADAIGPRLARLVVGDLGPYGIRAPESGPVARSRGGRIPVLDVGLVRLLREGRVRVAPAPERFVADGVVTADGVRRAVDAVILATGFRPRLEGFLEGAERLVDESGIPRRGPAFEAPPPAPPGLYFPGFATPLSGALREIGREARAVARSIGARRHGPESE
jgi:hypothetical protein